MASILIYMFSESKQLQRVEEAKRDEREKERERKRARAQEKEREKINKQTNIIFAFN